MSQHTSERHRQRNSHQSSTDRSMMRQKIGLAVAVLLIVGGLVGAVITLRPDPNHVTIPDQKTADPSRGNASASVVVREYSDFQCPACRAAHTTVADVIDSYGDKVRFDYNDFPLSQHQYAHDAAISAQCVYQQSPDAFWKYHDRLFDKQADWSSLKSLDEVKATWRGYVADLQLDTTAYDKCLTDPAIAASVDEDISEGKQIGVSGTPTVFVNDRLVDTSEGLESGLRAAIDAELQ